MQFEVTKLQASQFESQVEQVESRLVSCRDRQVDSQELLAGTWVKPSLQDWQLEAVPEQVWHSGLHFLQFAPEMKSPTPQGRHLLPGCR